MWARAAWAASACIIAVSLVSIKACGICVLGIRDYHPGAINSQVLQLVICEKNIVIAGAPPQVQSPCSRDHLLNAVYRDRDDVSLLGRVWPNGHSWQSARVLPWFREIGVFFVLKGSCPRNPLFKVIGIRWPLVLPCRQNLPIAVGEFWRKIQRFYIGSRLQSGECRSDVHLIQLALHDAQLPSKYDGADDAAGRNYSSQADHPAVATIDPIYKRLIGYGCLALVFLCTWLGMMLLIRYDRRQFGLNRRSSILLAAILMTAAFAFAGQRIALIFDFSNLL